MKDICLALKKQSVQLKFKAFLVLLPRTQCNFYVIGRAENGILFKRKKKNKLKLSGKGRNLNEEQEKK